MTCDEIRQLLLELNLDGATRRKVADALSHMETCAACREALRDFDRLGEVLRASNEGADPGSDDHDETGGALPAGYFAVEDRANVSRESTDQLNASPTGGWGDFEDKLLAAAQGGSRQQRLHWAWGSRFSPAIGSLAAVVLVGLIGFRIGRQTSGAGGAPAVGPGALTNLVAVADTRLAPADVAAKVRAFGEVNSVFDGRTRWLLLSSEQSDLGLGTQAESVAPATTVPTTNSGEPKVLLIRLHLVHDSEIVSNADLLIVAGTTADVVVPTKLGARLQYHVVTSAADPMHLSVRVEVPGGTKFQAGAAILGTSLELQPYRDESVGRLVLDTGAYDLQVAAVPSDLPG